MKQKTKHYRCTHCRKLVTVAVGDKSQNQKPQSTPCPHCQTRLDEHDEVVRMIRTRFQPAIKVC